MGIFMKKLLLSLAFCLLVQNLQSSQPARNKHNLTPKNNYLTDLAKYIQVNPIFEIIASYLTIHKPLFKLDGEDSVHLIFTPDSEYIASVSKSGVLTIW